ncbi:MAG: DUF4040 domain-containing protein [Chloroflexi bacterium]|nr:DUF4040 domain-containing protein [Chloroflexota bacterium]
MSLTLFIAVIVLIGTVPIAPLTVRYFGDRAPYLLGLVPAAIAVVLALAWQDVSAGETFGYSLAWIPGLDIAASWYLDGLTLTFALLVLGMGVLVLIYSRAYMAGEKDNGKFYAFLFLFMASMLGLALSDNIITMFIFWELTSISSYLLIGHKNTYESSRDSALQALIVTGAGGLALLAGLVALAIAAGTWEISEILQRVEVIYESPLAIPALILIAVGAFTKSAQAPFHFWLPNAMSAPTPVSAYLHSATMVKAGIFLLARLHPALNELWLWTPLLATVGGVTMLGAAWQATREKDLKRILAYSTVSSLGTMVFLLGLGHDSAVKAAVTLMLAHAFYKGALFMIAGGLDRQTGTRDISRLGGLRRAMPFTAATAALAAVSMAGLPPFFGYLGKETFFAATLSAGSLVVLLSLAAVVVSVLHFVVVGLVIFRPFTGSSTYEAKAPTDGPFTLWGPPMLLALLGLGVGIASPWIGSQTVGPAVNAIAGATVKSKLELWPGFGMVLLLSSLTFGLGAIAYKLQPNFHRVHLGWRFGGDSVFNWIIRSFLRVAVRLTMLIQNGQLSRYISIVVLFGTVLIFSAMFTGAAFRWPGETIVIRFHEVVIAGSVLVASVMAALTNSRLRAVAALGASGFGISTLFVFYGAPDLGMTQILVETLTVILLVSVFRFLPTTGTETSNRVHWRDAMVALAGGAAISVIALSAVATKPVDSITEFFRANSKSEANGLNVVNTILVDFRALDTFGEIAVLAAAAIGVIALLRLKPSKKGPQ